MAYYIHLHLLHDKEFLTRAKRDAAMKAIGKVLTAQGFYSDEVDFQAREDMLFVSDVGVTLKRPTTVDVAGTTLPERPVAIELVEG